MSARDDYPNLYALSDPPMVSIEGRDGQCEVVRALDEIDQLSRWKVEAIAVLARLDDEFERCQPLGLIGDFKSTAMADEILRLRAEVAGDL